MAKLIAGTKTIECRLVIFDKNGTLIDQNLLLLDLAKARQKSVKKYGGENTAALWERIVGTNIEQNKIDHGGPLATAPRREEILIAATTFYLNGFQWSEAKQLVQRAYDEADDSMEPPYGSVLLENVTTMLELLKRHGLKLAIASTDTHKRTAQSFETLKIASFFDAIIGSDEVANTKPSPDMIFEILRKTGLKPDEVVMVGDSASDMHMGKNAKLKACIGVLTGFTKKETLEQLADVVISSAADIRAV